MNIDLKTTKVGVIGLGYVGLPLAVEFGKVLDTIGFDINLDRIDELSRGIDSTLECSDSELRSANLLKYTSSVRDIEDCNVYIVTVPTPIDIHKQPDLTPLIEASKLLGKVVREGDTIIYESTVYPGATEDSCVPVIEEVSGLTYNSDFFVGYSPERINPGDKVHRITNILKVTSGSNEITANFVDDLYGLIIEAGTYKAESIKVAEAAKVIENVQRDVNIALVNELHQIFSKLDIDTRSVIEAASTKWNFMKLMPGLVGGHCISVDPYYLLHRSKEKGYMPDLIRTAREINDGMASFVSNDFVRYLIKNRVNPVEARVLMLGFSFKENCPDLRNTKNFDLFNELRELGISVDIHDSWVDVTEAKEEYGIELKSDMPSFDDYDALLLAVGHDNIISHIKNIRKTKLVYDFKGLLNKG